MSESNINFDVTAPVNPAIESGTSTNEELWLKFAGAKVQLDSINELIDVITIINRRLNTESAEVARAWIHKTIRANPLVDEGIEKLAFYKPTSEQIGSTYILHTADTQTLSLEDWTGDKPQAVRNVVQYKLRNEQYSVIRSGWRSCIWNPRSGS